jgi:hypothetical protein
MESLPAGRPPRKKDRRRQTPETACQRDMRMHSLANLLD